MREDPVLILMTPRSGSSMVTAIFAAHGLWLGRLDDQLRHGYANFENVDIRAELLNLWRPRSPGGSFLLNDPARVRRIFKRYVPSATRWAYKQSIAYWAALDGVFANPRFVFVRRPLQAVLASLREKRAINGMTRSLLEERTAMMDRLAADRGIPIVHAHRVVAGDYSTLERAFDHAGVPFDPDKARAVIDPGQWRH